MLWRDNKILIFFLDLFGQGLFLFPLLWGKIFYKKKTDIVRKILIIELWGIGDLVMMSSILKSLRVGYPDAKITLLSKTYAVSLFGESGYINEFVEYDFPWTKFKGKYSLWRWDWRKLFSIVYRLRKEKFDLVLDARGDIRNNLLSYIIGGKIRVGYDWTGGGYFLTDNLGKVFKNLHKVDAWVNLIKYLGLKSDDCKPSLCVSKEADDFAEDFLKANGLNIPGLLIGIHPGARIKIRRWPLDRFAKIAEYARDVGKARVIIILETEGYGDEIPIVGEHFKVKLTLRQLIGLIKRLDLLICNDGGAMHIATAVNTPVVAIFGPTNPAWFGPYGQNNAIVIEKDIPCRPCFDYCRRSKAVCLDRITVNQVNGVIDRVLDSLNKRSE